MKKHKIIQWMVENAIKWGGGRIHQNETKNMNLAKGKFVPLHVLLIHIFHFISALILTKKKNNSLLGVLQICIKTRENPNP